MILLLLILILIVPSYSQSKEFSQKNATAVLKTLVLDIGPRPMGSPAEQRAMNFAVAKFKEYGCDTSYVLQMTVAEGVNTKSGVAVGVKKGRTRDGAQAGRIIVIGGHIDSSGPDVPGANDDGSGTACVIELARVLCQRENESTVYFCCWGGEEQGLEGSKFFVENFKEIDSVALMLQIDMADGAGNLQADPDGSETSAPSWLVESAFEIFYDDLHAEGLIYPTEDATLNLASGGSWGSDHIPFIDKGIPAIDFTSDPAYPIHTAQDSWENFTPAGLKRTGDLIVRLFEKYDRGVPSRTTERYQLLQVGSRLVFVPYGVLWTFIVISVASGIIAFVIARRRRLLVDPSTKVRWSRFKLLLAALVIQTFIWVSESIVGLVTGYRFPWVNNQTGFEILGTLAGALGLWFVLQAIRPYRLSDDAYAFVLLALAPIVIAAILASIVTPELGIYLAASLLMFSFALMVRRPILKLLLFALSFAVAYNLVFFDGLALFQRIYANNQMSKWWQEALVHVAFIMALAAISLPFMHGFAAVYRGSGKDLLWLKKFRGKTGLAIATVACVVVCAYLSTRPVYDKKWYNTVRVEHKYELGADTNAVEIKGSEYFDGLTGRINGRDTTLTGRTNFASLPFLKNLAVPWLEVARPTANPATRSDSVWNVDRVLEIHSRFRPLRIHVTYASDEPFEVESTWAHGAKSPDPSQREDEKRKVFRWYSFPDTLLTIPVTFALRDSQRVSEFIEVVFDSVAYPISLKREFTQVSFRTTVTAVDTFSVKQ